MVTLAAVFGLIGLAIGYEFRDFTWFSRFGALVVAVGIALISRASVIGSDIKFHVITADTGLSHLDPEHYRRLGEPIPDWVIEDMKSRQAVGTLGPIVSLAGTVIWGFGDLLNKLACFQT